MASNKLKQAQKLVLQKASDPRIPVPRYVYRSLRDDEDPVSGLHPKTYAQAYDVFTHVDVNAYDESQYISTSVNFGRVVTWAQGTGSYPGKKRIAKIDLNCVHTENGKMTLVYNLQTVQNMQGYTGYSNFGPFGILAAIGSGEIVIECLDPATLKSTDTFESCIPARCIDWAGVSITYAYFKRVMYLLKPNQIFSAHDKAETDVIFPDGIPKTFTANIGIMNDYKIYDNENNGYDDFYHEYDEYNNYNQYDTEKMIGQEIALVLGVIVFCGIFVLCLFIVGVVGGYGCTIWMKQKRMERDEHADNTL